MKYLSLRFCFVLISVSLFVFFLFFSVQRPVEVVFQENVKQMTVKVRVRTFSSVQEASDVLKEPSVHSQTSVEESSAFEDSAGVEKNIVPQESSAIETHSIKEEPSVSVSETSTIVSEPKGVLVGAYLDINKVYSKIVYPVSMRKKGKQAHFEVQVNISSNGNISLSFPSFVEKPFVDSVKNAFKGIKATSATMDGVPVDSYFTMPIEFVLK